MTLLRAALWLPLVLAVASCAVNPVTGEQNFVLMSEDQEISLGRQSHQDIIKQFGLYEDTDLQRYVQKVGEQLAANSHRDNLIYRFTVLDSADVNAFALPGGYIYITRGIMAYLNSEAEMAAVLGHEIGHVTARHSVRQYTAQQAAGIGALIGAILVPELGSQAARTTIDLLSTSLLRGYGREHELEADRLGAEYLARSSYNPTAMMDVIRVLKNQEIFDKARALEEGREPKVYHGVFATHPDNDTRLKEVIAHATKLKHSGATPDKRLTYLHSIEGMTFGDSTKDGVVRGQNFYHRDLDFKIQFPSGWRIENKPDSITAYARSQEALLQVTVSDINKRIAPRQFMLDRLKLQQMRDGEAITVNGMEAYTATALSTTPYGKRRSRIAVVFHNDQAYIFAGAVKDDDGLGRVDDEFRQTVFSLDGLNRQERDKARALSLALLKPRPGRRMADIARDSPIGTYAESKLRLLNGLFPDGEPTASQWLKVAH